MLVQSLQASEQAVRRFLPAHEVLGQVILGLFLHCHYSKLPCFLGKPHLQHQHRKLQKGHSPYASLFPGCMKFHLCCRRLIWQSQLATLQGITPGLGDSQHTFDAVHNLEPHTKALLCKHQMWSAPLVPMSRQPATHLGLVVGEDGKPAHADAGSNMWQSPVRRQHNGLRELNSKSLG